ncbi:MAG: RNA methyltransferase [Planctomycetaceae bacterium]|jgi:tRNA (cytidine32/uridine32-2'-O)-methyltransferase
MTTPLPPVRIVLVEPEHPGNIGSAARALWTMGLSELVVVNPQCDPRAQEAYWLAHAAREVLDSLVVVPTLADALADTVFSVGTTRRRRRVAYPIFLPNEAVAQIRQRAPTQPAAIVFGRESSGLTNPELALCSVQSSIPCAREEHSLNLAQAVLVYCTELYAASERGTETGFDWRLVEHRELETLYQHLKRLLRLLDARPATTLENYIARFRRVFNRMALETRDVRLLLKLIHRVETELQSARTRPEV